MKTVEIKVGGWVQALNLVDETLPTGEYVVHSQGRGVGHVLGLGPDFATIFWERSETVCDCLFEELFYLCDASGL